MRRRLGAFGLLAYRELRSLLHRELNTEPDAQTRDIFERIRAEARETAARGPRFAARSEAAARTKGRVGTERSSVRSFARTFTLLDAPCPEPGDDAAPHYLPSPLTRFIGRERERVELRGLLRERRLLTLTGAGGCGKTRLALQAAADLNADFPDGICLVDLASLADLERVPQSVAAALGMREEPGRSLVETLQEFLAPRCLLLVLDNCEHLLAACAHLAHRLLTRCPGLRILATSRESLGIDGETSYRVPSLTVPEPGQTVALEALAEFEAARQARRRGKNVGTGMLAGRRMTIYAVNPNMRVWVGPDNLVYRTEGRRPEYQGVYAWEMRNLRRDMPLPDSLFRPPPDYKVDPAVMIPLPEWNSRR